MTTPLHPDCPFDREEWDAKLRDVIAAMDKRSQYNQWIVGLGVAILMTIGGVIWAQIAERIQVLETAGSPPMRERIMRAEAETSGLRRDIDELKAGQREILQILRTR